MARGQSPYQGRYTVPIADFSGIERAGAAWGDAFKGIGEQVEKYGLKKKEQQAKRGRIKNAVNLLDDLEKENPEHADKYAIKREQLLDEDIPLDERDALRQGLLDTISITSQMRNANLTRQLAEGTLKSNIEIAKHQERNLGISNAINQLNLDAKPEQMALQIKQLQDMVRVGAVGAKVAEATEETQIEMAETGAKMSALELWDAKRAKNVTQWRDRLRGGPLGSANYLNDIQDMQLELLKGNITEQNIANTLANAPQSIRSILDEGNKFADSIKKTSVSWKGKMMPFSDYMDLHFANDEDENLYPLKGEGAANTPQGRLWAQYTTSVLDTNERLGEAEAIFDTGEGTGEGESPDIFIGNKRLTDMTLPELQTLLPELRAEKQRLLQEKETEKTVRSEERQIPSYSTWGGPRYESQRIPPRQETIGETAERNKQLDAKIQKIDQQINEINSYLTTP